MSEYITVKDHKEFFTRWRHLYGLVGDDDDFLMPIAIQALSQGIVIFVVTGGKTVAMCVATGNKFGVVQIHALPQSSGEDQGRKCFALVKQWAMDKGYGQIQITTDNFSGASFRYFEKTLGLRRRQTVFGLTL